MCRRIEWHPSRASDPPPDTVYVGRFTPWENPYEVEPGDPAAVRLFDRYARRRLAIEPNWLDELRGRDLACSCPCDRPCHADVLLELANGPEPVKEPQGPGRDPSSQPHR